MYIIYKYILIYIYRYINIYKRWGVRDTIKFFCIGRSKLLQEVDALIERESGKMVLLLRIPYIGAPHMSFILSASKVKFIPYFIATVIGLVPGRYIKKNNNKINNNNLEK